MLNNRRFTVVILACVMALVYSAAPRAQGDGMTPLHQAAERGDRELTASLLASGANPAAVTRIGQYTPLHIAAKSGHAAIVRLLVAAKVDVGALTTTGATPLHFAAASGSAEAVTILLDNGADVNVREPQWGQTPLMFAAGSGRRCAGDREGRGHHRPQWPGQRREPRAQCARGRRPEAARSRKGAGGDD